MRVISLVLYKEKYFDFEDLPLSIIFLESGFLVSYSGISYHSVLFVEEKHHRRHFFDVLT